MTGQETTFFKLLDEYARTRHQCFLTEMLPDFPDKLRYSWCFRPIGVGKGGPDQYTCRYLSIDAAEMAYSAGAHCLSRDVSDKSDKELSSLRVL